MRIPGLLVALLAVNIKADALVGDVPSIETSEDYLETRQACSGPATTNVTSWWRAVIDHNGTTPTAADQTFQYYRTAVQYGADKTGVNDSSTAFNWAIGGQCSRKGASVMAACD
jgi:hypothetical protein